MREKLLTTREVSQLLGISEKDVIELTQRSKMPHFKIAGEFLRFRKDDVVKLKKEIHKRFNIHKEKSSFAEQIGEYFYFNDFYIVSACIILLLTYIIFKG